MNIQHEPLGLVEQLTPFRVQGWAFDRARPDLALDLVLRVDGTAVQWFRPHLRADSIAQYLGMSASSLGPTAFDIPAPEVLADGRPHRVEVVHAPTGAVLPSSASTVQYFDPHVPLARIQPLGISAAALQADPEVTVVVLNRNGRVVLQALLESWEIYNQSTSVEWVVIDHASTDGSLELLESWKERLDLRVQALPINDSFSASCNLGASMAKGQHLLFLNNDIVWLHDALPQMLQTLRSDPDTGIVGIKLLKAIGESSAGMPVTDVQHLGVRFKQHDQGYWPYEAAPSVTRREAEYSPQQVPVVTGAVLLCRKADFMAVGGFDTSYFYGFEDVELCLRLAHRLCKRVVCRNDLTALHRHGHTRLTGREAPIFDRVQHNATVLNRQMGLWAKVAWWRSLLRADGIMCSERLTIGLLVGKLPEPGRRERGTRASQKLLSDMARLGTQLEARFPSVRVVLLHSGGDAYDVRGMHAVVVTSSQYDIRLLRNARPDVRCIAYVHGAAEPWSKAPWWLDFDGYIAVSSVLYQSWAESSGVVIDESNYQAPLGRWLRAESSEGPAGTMLRIAIRLSMTAASAATRPSSAATAWAHAQALRQSLKQEGAACWIQWADEARQPLQRLADVCIIALGGHGSKTLPAAMLDHACLNVVCQQAPGSKRTFPLTKSSAQPDLWLRGIPRLAELQQAIEKRVGHTFLAS
ncbi:glycosyltransferase [Acidovorax sp. LjRoot66]|uniref:glycosyltransferase n=1 Tax=Acidovorax sp. LjRoot66 TaxID=3342334 RepID=UPI003ECC8DB0